MFKSSSGARSEDECNIWRAFLDALKELDSPKLVSYGAYEIRFLKKMTERWKVIGLDSELVEKVVNESVNLLATMYGRIYFPTYGNSLKDVAHWLGFRWASPHPSGAAAALLRRCWELTSNEQTRRELIVYNADDCHAAEVVSKAILSSVPIKNNLVQPILKPSMSVLWKSSSSELS